jgi:phage terminase large subunit
VGEVWLPHDARAKSLQTGKSMIEQFLEAGITPRLVPELSVLDGIEAARLTLPFCHFDQTKCYDGIEHLRGYNREWDEKNQMYRSRPKHDQHSHASDAFRYLALAAKRISRRVDDVPTVGLKQQAQGAHYAFSLNDLWDTGPVQSTRIG